MDWDGKIPKKSIQTEMGYAEQKEKGHRKRVRQVRLWSLEADRQKEDKART